MLLKAFYIQDRIIYFLKRFFILDFHIYVSHIFLFYLFFIYSTQIQPGQIHGFSFTLLKSMGDYQSFGETCCTLIGECSFSETVVNTNQLLVKTLKTTAVS